MRGNRLYKNEKLCSVTAIDTLFLSAGRKDPQICVNSVMAYPWRAVWRVNPQREAAGTRWQFLISVPKKRLRIAVDRVTMRRRMREAYRLNRRPICESAAVDMALIYVADKLTPFDKSVRAINKIMDSIELHISQQSATDTAL